MKKINVVIAFAMLCGFSCESFALSSHAILCINNQEKSNHQVRQNNPQARQNNTQQNAQSSARSICIELPGANNGHLAGVNIPVLEKPNNGSSDFNFGEGLNFTAHEVMKIGGDCGYDSLFTDRDSVFNAIKEVYCTKWNDLLEEQRITLKELIENLSEDLYGRNNRFTYNGPSDWDRLNLEAHISGMNKKVLSAELGGLICYIRGENLRVFSINKQYMKDIHGDVYKFNKDWPIRYMLHQGGHWQALEPKDKDEAKRNDKRYNDWYFITVE